MTLRKSFVQIKLLQNADRLALTHWFVQRFNHCAALDILGRFYLTTKWPSGALFHQTGLSWHGVSGKTCLKNYVYFRMQVLLGCVGTLPSAEFIVYFEFILQYSY